MTAPKNVENPTSTNIKNKKAPSNANVGESQTFTGEEMDRFDSLFWGPYLAERQWGTIREDYSSDITGWNYISYEGASKHAYHWGEDGLLGISDKDGMLCSSLALWNGNDNILKERLFGLTGKEGNHGEDVKELYYYLDNTPTHNYMHALYKYPQKAFPYQALRELDRLVTDPEYEILDTGVFEGNDYWDVHVEYAKPLNHHLICKYTFVNKSSNTATLHAIPQFYFRNIWNNNSDDPEVKAPGPSFQFQDENSVNALYNEDIYNIEFVHSKNVTLNDLMFTNNESAQADLSKTSKPLKEPSPSGIKLKEPSSNKSPTMRRGGPNIQLPAPVEHIVECGKKDAFHKYIIYNEKSAIIEDRMGTKFGAWMTCEVPAQESFCVFWQIIPKDFKSNDINTQTLDYMIGIQKEIAEGFYQQVIPRNISTDQANVCRQAIAGLLWSKQFYNYSGAEKCYELKKLHTEAFLKTPAGKKHFAWKHLTCQDILLMPDKWEFPWFASWDTAIQAVLFASMDMRFAQLQICIMLSDRYMHPNGQIPGCEFDFGDPNPPIMAWAVWKIHQKEHPKDIQLMKTLYPRLLINYQRFRKIDSKRSNLFGKGFLGLDNISVFNRSDPPHGLEKLKQADATGWMGQFALNMLQITLELCKCDICLSDMAIHFLKEFLNITHALNEVIDKGGLWCPIDEFYYDVVQTDKDKYSPIRVRSWSGLVPLLACAKISLKHAPVVKEYLMNCNRCFAPYVCKLLDDEFFLTMVPYIKLKSILHKVFSEEEFLSPFGIRSLSKKYDLHPYTFEANENSYSLRYQPGESDSKMFGGNSNWRGPIWLCMNYFFVECMERYSDLDQIFTHPLSMEYPSARIDSQRQSFLTIVNDLCHRIVSIFSPDQRGARPVHGYQTKYLDGDWRELVLFYEYFHADTGRGCGASHQTGWSALYLEFIRKLSILATIKKKK